MQDPPSTLNLAVAWIHLAWLTPVSKATQAFGMSTSRVLVQ